MRRRENDRQVEDALLDQTVFDDIAGIRFGNLTAPMLGQIVEGNSWSVLAYIAKTLSWIDETGYGSGGQWLIVGPAGHMNLTLTKSRQINVVLKFVAQSDEDRFDDLRGRRLSITGGCLPETMIQGLRGARLDEVVDCKRCGGILGSERIRRIENMPWGYHVHLDMAFVQLTRDDLMTMRQRFLSSS